MPLPFLKPNARLFPQSNATATTAGGGGGSGSKKKKSVPAEESKLLTAKPLLYGAAAIKSLRINQDQTNQAAAELEVHGAHASNQPYQRFNDGSGGPFGIDPRRNAGLDAGVGVGADLEEISATRKAEMMMNFYRRLPTDESMTNAHQASSPSHNNRSNPGGASGSRRKPSSRSTNTNYRIQSIQEPKPEEDFEEFKNRVLNRTATKASKRQERGLISSTPGGAPTTGPNPLLPMDFERDPEVYINRKQMKASDYRNPHRQTLEDLASQFPFNFDDFMKTSKRSTYPVPDDTGRIIRHAERLLEESAKLQPSPDLGKRLEASQHSLEEQNLLLHQNRRDVPAIPQPGVVSTADEQRREREFDPNLDELQYEPLAGLGTHGPAKLLQKLKAKRDEVLKYGPRAGDDDASLGAGWAQILTMNSSILDEALSDFASELVPKSRRPRQVGQTGLAAAVANAKAKVKAENASGSSQASTSRQTKKPKPKSAGGQSAQSPRENAGVSPKGQPFKEGQDYYFQTHPTFMQMVQDIEATSAPAPPPTSAPVRPLPDIPGPATGNRNTKRTPITGLLGMGNANTLAQKMEIKTVTSARPADVLYKPPIGKQLLLASNPESRTPSGLLDLLDAAAAGKGKGPQQQQARGGRDGGGQHAHTTHETATERQKRIKAEKDDEIMKYLRNKPDNIRLFSSGVSGAAGPNAAPYSPTRGRTATTTGLRNR